MARGDSSIRVNIIGDAKSLQGAAKDSEKAVGGIGKAAKLAGGLIAGAFAVDAVFDFAQTALAESDRIGDATTRLEAQLGDLSGPLIEAAGNMERLGGSRQDVLELEARFTDLATAAGMTADEIARNASGASEAALALSLLGIGGGEAATVLDLIGKAVGGADKPLKELGITLTDTEVEARAMADTGKDNADALTDQELAAARYELIMEKLAPRITSVTDGTADLEQKQKELEARFETFTGKVGEAVEGPLTDLLGVVIALADNIPRVSDALGTARENVKSLTGPAKVLADVLEAILDSIAHLPETFLRGKGLAVPNFDGSGGGSNPSFRPGGPTSGLTVQVVGGSPEVVEQSVIEAIRRATLKGLI